MARILVIDSNPAHQRALGGLLRYRTRHSVVMFVSCVDGARAIVSQRPDLIMINALMFMRGNFAFARVLQKNARTAAIPVLVHTTGTLEALTRRRLELHGVAGIVELPVSAGELSEEIERGLQKAGRPGPAGGVVKPVQWMRAEKPGPAGGKRPVRPVNWRVDGAQTQKSPVQPTSPRAGRPPAQRSTPRRDRAGPGADGSQQAFRGVPAQAMQGTGAESRAFRPIRWARADPERVVNPPPKEGE